VTTVLFTMFAFGWLILPLVLFGLDSTLDPGTLALYPLRLRPLAVGLIAASATGAWPLANLVGLLGVTVGLAGGVLGVPIALVAVVLQVLFCIVLARFVTTSLAGLLRSRRGKDLAGLLILPIFALYEAFVQVVPRMSAEGKTPRAASAASTPGCAGRRLAWPRTRSETPPPDIRLRLCSACCCSPRSSSPSARCGSGSWPAPWSRSTRPRRRRR